MGRIDDVLQEVLAAIKELPNESAEDGKITYEGVLRLVDISMPYASGEVAQALAVMRSSLEQINEPDALDVITPDELRARSEAIVQELKQNLEAGESLTPAFIRAQTKFKALTMRDWQGDEETARFVLTN